MESEKPFVYMAHLGFEFSEDIICISVSFDEETLIKNVFKYVTENQWVSQLLSSRLTKKEIENTHNIRDLNELFFMKRSEKVSWIDERDQPDFYFVFKKMRIDDIHKLTDRLEQYEERAQLKEKRRKLRGDEDEDEDECDDNDVGEW